MKKLISLFAIVFSIMFVLGCSQPTSNKVEDTSASPVVIIPATPATPTSPTVSAKATVRLPVIGSAHAAAKAAKSLSKNIDLGSSVGFSSASGTALASRPLFDSFDVSSTTVSDGDQFSYAAEFPNGIVELQTIITYNDLGDQYFIQPSTGFITLAITVAVHIDADTGSVSYVGTFDADPNGSTFTLVVNADKSFYITQHIYTNRVAIQNFYLTAMNGVMVDGGGYTVADGRFYAIETDTAAITLRYQSTYSSLAVKSDISSGSFKSFTVCAGDTVIATATPDLTPSTVPVDIDEATVASTFFTSTPSDLASRLSIATARNTSSTMLTYSTADATTATGTSPATNGWKFYQEPIGSAAIYALF